jgi:superfamily II DNA or RNA helicase
VFSGSFLGFKQLSPPEPAQQELQAPPPPVVKPAPEKVVGDSYEPLPIWVPTAEELSANPNLTQLEVPYLVCKWLRPHQREGVKFMCECVLGQRNLYGQPQPSLQPKEGAEGKEEGGAAGESSSSAAALSSSSSNPADNPGAGAILADDMGLGKTLQSVALVYTLLTQGFEVGKPVARKVVIVTPTSLVANWANEIVKWLGKGTLNVVALSEVGKDNIECGMDSFTSPRSKDHVLIVSYDTFRRHVDKLKRPGLCDLLICDEAHRLKNNKTATYVALDSLPTKRRVLLSGTPMQNDLSEFFSMINFTNRRVLGDQKAFRKYYELPILLGREPEALEQEAEEGAVRSAELSAIVNQFVLRRTNVLLKKHLPPKVIQVVCCRPSALQVQLYQHFLASKSVRRLTSMDSDDGEGRRGGGGGGLQALPLITSLKKLCNHPKLIYDTANAAVATKGSRGIFFTDDTGAVEKVPPALVAMFKSMKPLFERYDNGAFARNPSLPAYSGKMFVLERLLLQVRASSTDRVVIVSNFTSALDVIASMCVARRWDHLRLDGSTSIKKRQQLVDQLSDHRGNKVFCFLLSSRAGGCGLNLIGANRLILFDPDWNPAVDKQAAARVWRDGQAKRCFIYRFLTTGTIEEKVYQRQLSKEGLSGVLGGSTADASLTKDELRDLFQLDQKALETPSDTHASLACDCMDSYQIRTEEEAAKADAAHKAEVEKHAREVAAEEAARKKDEAAADDMDVAEPGAPAAAASNEQVEGAPAAAAASSAAAAASSDTAMVDAAPEVDDGDGEEGGGEGNDGGGVPSEESSDDDGADLDGFVVSGSDDDDGDDYGSKSKKGKKSAAASKSKPRKKDGPRKQRKKKATIGSLNYPQLHALTAPTLGQRGEPPEEELINWAHHATSNSIPDPAFRLAASQYMLLLLSTLRAFLFAAGHGSRAAVLLFCYCFVCFVCRKHAVDRCFSASLRVLRIQLRSEWQGDREQLGCRRRAEGVRALRS